MWAMTFLPFLLTALIQGVTVGFIYSIVTVAFSMSWGISDIVNISVAYQTILAAYVVYWCYVLWGVNVLLFLLILPPLMALINFSINRFLLSRLIKQHVLNSLLVFFGISYALEGLMGWQWSPIQRTLIAPYLEASYDIAGIFVSVSELITLIVTLVIYSILIIFLKKTRTGRSIRAVAQNKKGAYVVGINVERIHLLIQAIAGAAAGVAGVLLAITYSFFPAVGAIWVGYLFLVVVLGSKGSVTGSLVGGAILGIIQAFIGFLLPQLWMSFVVFLILVVVLLIRPMGLLKGYV